MNYKFFAIAAIPLAAVAVWACVGIHKKLTEEDAPPPPRNPSPPIGVPLEPEWNDQLWNEYYEWNDQLWNEYYVNYEYNDGLRMRFMELKAQPKNNKYDGNREVYRHGL